MAAAADDVCGFCFALAISTAIIIVLPGVAGARRMGAFLFFTHVVLLGG
jgi:hypothetical protein